MIKRAIGNATKQYKENPLYPILMAHVLVKQNYEFLFSSYGKITFQTICYS